MDDSELDGMITPGGSSIRDEDSGGRESVLPEGDDEDDGLYYIPPRRPSLDLGQTPMDTSQWHYVDQALSPAQSYSSMESEGKEHFTNMDEEDGLPTSIRLDRADSYSSCYSISSDDCEKKLLKVRNKDDPSPEPSVPPELIENNKLPLHPSVTIAFTFKAICKVLGKLKDVQFIRFKRILWQRYPQSFNAPFQSMDMVDIVDRILECYSLRVSLQVTRSVLVELELEKLVEYLETLCIRNEVRYELSETLKKIYGTTSVALNMDGEKRPLNDVYITPFMTSESDNGPNIEHEILTIDKLNTVKRETRISTHDIFSVEENYNQAILLTGNAGTGKTIVINKLILDWAEGKSHQHVDFMFPLRGREVKHFGKLSLVQILETLYPETKKLRDRDFSDSECLMVFVVDGLDEICEEFDCESLSYISDLTKPKRMIVIIVNLLRGRMVYGSKVLIASRPLMRHIIPYDTNYSEFEVRGFCDPVKDEYFQKRIKDSGQAARVIEFVNSSKTLRIMCHLPLFCSLVAEECLSVMKKQGPQAELPRSLTYMFTKLVLHLLHPLRKHRAPDLSLEEELQFIMNIGKLAYTLLENGNFQIRKYDWKEDPGLDKEAVTRSGLCMQYMIDPFVLHNEKVISYLHPTVQEYMASLYVFLTYRNLGKNIFEQPKGKFARMFKGKNTDLYKCAVERSLLCQDGKLDLFLRFLCGMANKSNMELLQPYFTSQVKWTCVAEDVAAFIRKKITENQYPARIDNLKQCLVELGVQGAVFR